MPELAVVIVSWNVRELLAGCLQSLFVDLDRSQWEAQVWVVDNASSDGSPDMVRRAFPHVRLVESGVNLGFAAGNNLALRELVEGRADRPRYVWLLNPDTEVQPGATAALIAPLDRDPQAAVAGAQLLYADGTFQPGAFRFPGLLQLAFELFPLPARLYETRLNGRYSRRLYEQDDPFPIDHPLGASMLVRTQAMAHVGLMDEGYHMYCEEIDWCWRMHRAGWGAVCAPRARVVHHAGRSTAQVPIPSFVNLWTSRARLYARTQPAWKWRAARAMVRAGMRRIARSAPERAPACREIVAAWEAAG